MAIRRFNTTPPTPMWRGAERPPLALARALATPLARRPLAAAALVAAAVFASVAVSLAIQPRYEARSSYDLLATPGPDTAAAVKRRLAEVVAARGAELGVESAGASLRPGSKPVDLVVAGDDPRRVRRAAGVLAMEMAAADQGLTLAQLRARIAAAPTARERRRLLNPFAASTVRAPVRVEQVAGRDPLRHGALAAVAGLLVALAAAHALEAAARRAAEGRGTGRPAASA